MRARTDLGALLRLTELADYVVPFALRSAAQLGLADHLADGPRPLEELATLTDSQPAALRRLLRCLVAKGVFAEPRPGHFGLSPKADLLRDAHPLSLRDAFPLLAADLRAWAQVGPALASGAPAFARVHGQPYYDYLRDHPQDSTRVDRSVQSANRLVVRMFDRLYEWHDVRLLVDVGGGNGSFLAGLLARHPHLRGLLFDQAHVVAGATRVLAQAGVQARCEVRAGSFFDAVPAGGDAYLLKTILHDWDDAQALAILHAIRRVLPAGGRLLVLEALLEPGNDYDIGKLLDLNSFVLAGGVDRNQAQLAALLAQADFRLRRVQRTTNALALLEAVPASDGTS